tara:strand:- start:866 stop:1042 length:177 start_codon:yes stop_codon:yes gene_type:complete
MKTYTQTINEKKYQYFYDTAYKSWCIYEVDLEGNQLYFEGEYFANKTQLKKSYNVNFK